MDVRMEDGTIIKNVPEGTTKAQLLEKLKAGGHNIDPGLVKWGQANPEAAAQPLPPPAQPDQSRMGKLKDMFLSSKGAPITGGPIGAITREGYEQVDKAVDQGAYAGGGAVTDAASRTGLPPQVSAGLGTAANFGIRAVPAVVGSGAGKVTQLATRPMARGLMQSALKPGSHARSTGDAAKAIDTMLEGGFNVTSAGVGEMRSEVMKLNAQVEKLIKASDATVNKSEVRRELAKKLKEFRKQVNPSSDVKAIKAAWADFKGTVDELIPVQAAQEIKQGTYKALGGKSFGELKGADTEAQKTLARGLRMGIEKNVPGVKAPNKQMQKLLNAIELAEGRAGVAGNRDLAGIAMLANNPWAGAAMLADRSPWVKSYLARLLYSGPPVVGGIGGALSGAKPSPEAPPTIPPALLEFMDEIKRKTIRGNNG